ncbi:MAG TPA: hypothetical protein VER17_03875 [Tepidisphaeraceae bacterium]|nr:hypothetical protein [Tepidisphaeraceae bacterium]
MTEPTRVLEYRKPTTGRGRRALRIMVVLVAALSLLYAAMIGWKRYTRHLAAKAQQAAAKVAAQQALAANQRRLAEIEANLAACRAYAAPPDQVVCDLNPTRAKALLDASAGYEPIQRIGGAELTPSCWSFIGRWAIYPDSDGAGKWILSRGGIAFLHERAAPGNTPAIVRVQVALISAGNPVLNPLIIRGVHGTGVAPRELGIVLDKSDDFRVFAGQPDPVDPSRFTIGYELNGARGLIDARLLPDDDLDLVPRDGQVMEGQQFPVWQPAATKAKPLTAEAARKWPQ